MPAALCKHPGFSSEPIELMPNRVTIKDVARAAGVSVGSVSNVINGSPSLKKETISRVLSAMEDLDYRPNAAAQNMRTRLTRAVGFVISDISNPIYAGIAKESERLLVKEGYHLIVVDSDNRPGQEVDIFSMLGANRVDAIVATVNDEADAKLRLAIENCTVPVVLLDREIPGISNGSVCIDYALGIKNVLGYLHDLGHREIGLLCGGDKVRPGRECAKGYRLARTERNLDVDETLIRSGSLSADFAYQETASLLARPDRPTALVCGGNRLFAGAMRAVKRLGLKIPSELSLVACDDTDLTELANPGFTVLRRDPQALGQALTREVLSAMKDERYTPQKMILEPELVIRGSCSPYTRKYGREP